MSFLSPVLLLVFRLFCFSGGRSDRAGRARRWRLNRCDRNSICPLRAWRRFCGRPGPGPHAWLGRLAGRREAGARREAPSQTAPTRDSRLAAPGGVVGRSDPSAALCSALQRCTPTPPWRRGRGWAGSLVELGTSRRAAASRQSSQARRTKQKEESAEFVLC